MKEMMTGNRAAAWGARLAGVEYVPSFPITPQTEIIETLARWAAIGKIGARVVQVESEHSMLTAAGAAAATGVRVYTATSSQGLVYGMEALYMVSGMRVPLVLVNVSRALAAPINIEVDHNDVLAARDSGFIQIHCESCQEVVDAIILGYRIAEDERVRAPVLVNMDGFVLSFTREPVELPDEAEVESYLLPLTVRPDHFRASNPLAQGVAVLQGTQYSYFRYQLHLAVRNALQVHREAAEEFAERFGRRYSPVEAFEMEDAQVCVVVTNSFSTRAKAVVKALRREGKRVGLIRLHLLRPFPEAEIASLLRGVEGVVVFDQNLAPGKGGILHGEICEALYHEPDRPSVVMSVVGGLGGRDVSPEELGEAVERAFDALKRGVTPEPLFLWTAEEEAEMQEFLRLAGKIDEGGAAHATNP